MQTHSGRNKGMSKSKIKALRCEMKGTFLRSRARVVANRQEFLCLFQHRNAAKGSSNFSNLSRQWTIERALYLPTTADAGSDGGFSAS